MAKQQDLSLEELLKQALVSENEQPYEVPNNWVWVNFHAIASGQHGAAFKSDEYTPQGIPIIRMGNVVDTDFVKFENKVVYISKSRLEEFDKYIVLKNDIVMTLTDLASKGEFLGTVAIYNNDNIALLNQRLLNIHFNREKILNKFMFYALRCIDFRVYVTQPVGGSIQKNIGAEFVFNYKFPLPPLAEQQRIVDRIESLFEKLDQAKGLIHDAFDSFENRKAAILHKAFTGELTKKWREENGVGIDSWEEKTLKEVCYKITDGEHFRPPIVESGIPFLSAKDVRDNGVSFLDVLYVSKETAEKALKRCNPEKGDILIVSRGATVGRMCIVDTDDVFCLLGSVILLKVQKMQSRLLCYYLKSPLLNQKLIETSGATAQQAIYLRDIKGIIIPIPALPEQREIVRILDSLFEKEQNAKNLCDLIDKIDLVKKAILARAFRGKLGTNDPTEESAVKLLKEVLNSSDDGSVRCSIKKQGCSRI